MKITILQENISKALNHVVRAVAQRPNIPVLANVLIEAKKGKLKFSATNLEIGINAEVGAEVIKEGSLTVSAKLLFEFLNSLKSGKITLTQTGQKVEVKSVDNKAEFVMIPADDFPKVPEAEKTPIMVINAYNLAEAIAKTSFAAAQDDSRPVLTGLLFEAKGKKLRIVGVDGFRLSKVDLELSAGPKEVLKEIIPAKSLQEVERIIKSESSEKDDVEIYMLGDKNQILFKIGDIELSSRLIEGEYPDYNQIIPKETTNSFKVLKSEFQSSVKVIMIFARNVIGHKTRFVVKSTEKKLILSTNIIDVGNNESTVDLANIKGESFKTAYNAKFIMDMLNSFKGDELSYRTNGVTAPGVFEDKKDKDYLHIIMPMRID